MREQRPVEEIIKLFYIHKVPIPISLWHAICNGAYETVKFLLETKYFQINNEEHLTAAINRSSPIHAKILKLLVENGANLHTQTKWGSAFQNKVVHLDILKYLLEMRVTIEPHFSDIENLIRIYERGAKVLELLLQYGEIFPDNILITATQFSYLDVIKLLHKYGASVHVHTYAHKTPLFYAVQRRKRNIVKFFLSVGADPNFHSSVLYNGNYCSRNSTPLHQAVVDGYYFILIIIILSFLLKMIEYRSVDIIWDLILHGADTKIKFLKHKPSYPRTYVNKVIILKQNISFFYTSTNKFNVGMKLKQYLN